MRSASLCEAARRQQGDILLAQTSWLTSPASSAEKSCLIWINQGRFHGERWPNLSGYYHWSCSGGRMTRREAAPATGRAALQKLKPLRAAPV